MFYCFKLLPRQNKVESFDIMYILFVLSKYFVFSSCQVLVLIEGDLMVRGYAIIIAY